MLHSWKPGRLLLAGCVLVALAFVGLPASSLWAVVTCPDETPDQAKCNDSYLTCESCTNDPTACGGPASICEGEVLQDGTYGTKLKVDFKTKQDGPAAVCKKKYKCKWDNATGKCVVDLNNYIQDSNKATLRELAC